MLDYRKIQSNEITLHNFLLGYVNVYDRVSFKKSAEKKMRVRVANGSSITISRYC